MLYTFNALKETPSRTITIPCAVHEADRDMFRTFLQWQGFVILSVKGFEKSPAEFGNIRVTIQGKEQNFTITTNIPELKQAAKDILESNLNILDINSYQPPTAPDIIANILAWAKETTRIIKQAQAEKKHAEEEAKKQMYSDGELKKTQAILESTLQDITNLQNKVQGIIGGKLIKDLHDNEEELKKLRMGSNKSKISTILENVFMIMEEIEMNYIEHLKANEYSVIKNGDSELSNTDVLTELSKFDKAQKVNQAGTAKGYDDQYYVFMGKGGIFARFFEKDLKAHIAQVANILSSIIDFLGYTLIMTLIIIGLYILFEVKISGKPEDEILHIFKLLIDVSSAAIIVFILQLAKKKNTVWLFTLLIIGVTGYFVFTLLIDSNFALSF